MHEAARQYVRKLSGFGSHRRPPRLPSSAIAAVADASMTLLNELVSPRRRKDREVEVAKARARAAERFARA